MSARTAEENEGIWARLTGSFLISILGGTVLLAVHLAQQYHWVTTESAFGLVTVAMLGYMGLEALHVYQSDEPRWVLIPPVLISGATFVLNFAGTNLIYWMRPPEDNGMLTYGVRSYEWMTFSMKLTFAGAIALWVGYKLDIGRKIRE